MLAFSRKCQFPAPGKSMGKKHREIMWKRKGRENQTQARQPLLVLFGLSCHQVFPCLGAEALSGWRHAPLCKRNLYGEGSSHWGTAAGCPKSKPLTKFLTCKDHNNHKDSLIHQRLLNFKPKRVHLGSQLLSSTYCLPEKKNRGLKIGITRTGYSVRF